jgi:O-succinylbenzoic acid--CoA ligase
VSTRRSDLIVTGGENVYPAEVEHVLAALPGVEAAVVFGVPDETWGQVVAAVLVARESPTDEAVARHVAAELAPYKWPRRIASIQTLPLTPSGKVDRGAMRRTIGPLLRRLDVRALL